jgi:pimeloyl-ACP methyl ester carboxylesterase
MADLHVEGARFHVEVEEGPGPLALFLHGALAAGAAFRGQRAAFRGAMRMAFPDLRGHGRSSHGGVDVPWESVTYAQMARDALALMDALSPGEPVHLVGVSMGGLVAAHATAQAPRRVASLALVSTPGLHVPERQRFFAATPPEDLSPQTRRLGALWHGEPYWRDLARHLFPQFARGEPFPARVPATRALILQATADELLRPEEADAWAARATGEVHVERPPGDHAFFADGRAGSQAANAALHRFLLAGNV